MEDLINHPKHYTQASVQLEPIDILRYAPFALGNVCKYIIRAGHKGDALTDLKKARFYLGCALENYYVDCDNDSKKFFIRYWLLLRKFKPFNQNEYFYSYSSYSTFLTKTAEYLNKKIEELENA